MSGALLLLICLVGAVVPGVGSEVALAGALAVADGPARLCVIVLAATMQAAGKLVVYAAAAAGAAGAPVVGRGQMSGPGWRASAFVFVSALTSVPPLYATALACGALGHGRARFGITVLAARTLRYAAIALFVDAGRMVLP